MFLNYLSCWHIYIFMILCHSIRCLLQFTSFRWTKSATRLNCLRRLGVRRSCWSMRKNTKEIDWLNFSRLIQDVPNSVCFWSREKGSHKYSNNTNAREYGSAIRSCKTMDLVSGQNLSKAWQLCWKTHRA